MEQRANVGVEQAAALMDEYAHMCARLRMLRFEEKCAADMLSRNMERESFTKYELAHQANDRTRLLRPSIQDAARRRSEIERLDYTISILNEAIECLEEHHRKTLKALYVHKLTYENAGRALHASASTIKRWRREALRCMTRILEN